MRSRAVLLILLMMGMSVSSIAMADSTISSSTTWSGNVVLSGNVTVDASTTLVIESGTVVDAQNYWLQIDGTLEASDAQFMTPKHRAVQDQPEPVCGEESKFPLAEVSYFPTSLFLVQNRRSKYTVMRQFTSQFPS